MVQLQLRQIDDQAVLQLRRDDMGVVDLEHHAGLELIGLFQAVLPDHRPPAHPLLQGQAAQISRFLNGNLLLAAGHLVIEGRDRFGAGQPRPRQED